MVDQELNQTGENTDSQAPMGQQLSDTTIATDDGENLHNSDKGSEDLDLDKAHEILSSIKSEMEKVSQEIPEDKVSEILAQLDGISFETSPEVLEKNVNCTLAQDTAQNPDSSNVVDELKPQESLPEPIDDQDLIDQLLNQQMCSSNPQETIQDQTIALENLTINEELIQEAMIEDLATNDEIFNTDLNHMEPEPEQETFQEVEELEINQDGIIEGQILEDIMVDQTISQSQIEPEISSPDELCLDQPILEQEISQEPDREVFNGPDPMIELETLTEPDLMIEPEILIQPEQLSQPQSITEIDQIIENEEANLAIKDLAIDIDVGPLTSDPLTADPLTTDPLTTDQETIGIDENHLNEQAHLQSAEDESVINDQPIAQEILADEDLQSQAQELTQSLKSLEIDIESLKSEKISDTLSLDITPKEQNPENTSQYSPEEETEFLAAKDLQDGQTFSAYNKIIKGLEKFPNNLRLRHIGALALLKTGCIDDAKKMLEPILQSYNWDWENPNFDDLNEDMTELCANIFKESWRSTHFQKDLVLSQQFYEIHYKKTQSLHSGVYAASLAWLLGNDEKSQNLAQEILEQTKNIDKSTNENDLKKSLLAQAMAYLLLEQYDLAKAMFTRAQEVAKINYSLNVQTLHHLKFLHEGGYFLPQEVINALQAPTIVVFTGQPIDPLDAPYVKFSQELEPHVYKRIAQKLDEINATIGYSSATSGSDILFIEAMLERGAEINIIIPFDLEDFIICNVRPAGPRWEKRFRSALERAASVTMATEEKYLGHNMLYRFSNMVLHGMAEIRGDFLLSPPHLIAVWDSQPDSLVGGASDFIDHWADIKTLHLIDLDDVKEGAQDQLQIRSLPAHLKVARAKKLPYQESLLETPRIIKSMLFADFSGYSKLKEEHIPGFLTFLNELKIVMEKVAPKPDAINTWGDALFVVMQEASILAEYALKLSELVPQISEDCPGLPTIQVRTSLHAGPVYETIDPFRNLKNYYGGHITRAARLEPVTMVGQVYTTEQFMALFTAEQSAKRVEAHQKNAVFVEEFTCQYVGRLPLAKGFGAQPIYHLRRL